MSSRIDNMDLTLRYEPQREQQDCFSQPSSFGIGSFDIAPHFEPPASGPEPVTAPPPSAPEPAAAPPVREAEVNWEDHTVNPSQKEGLADTLGKIVLTAGKEIAEIILPIKRRD